MVSFEKAHCISYECMISLLTSTVKITTMTVIVSYFTTLFKFLGDSLVVFHFIFRMKLTQNCS